MNLMSAVQRLEVAEQEVFDATMELERIQRRLSEAQAVVEMERKGLTLAWRRLENIASETVISG